MKILLAVDGSVYTKHMLSYIAAHNELAGRDQSYTAFTAVSPIPLHAAHFLNHATLESHYKEEAEKVFAPLRAFCSQQGWALQTAYAAGAPADAITIYAEAEKPDLIIMGTHGHSALANLVMGSVVNGVLARCKVPVLLVR